MARLMRVIADQLLHPSRHVAYEVALRIVAIVLVTLAILGILPAVTEVAA